MSDEITLTKAQAKELAKRIKAAVVAAADQIQLAGRLLLEFRDAEAWRPLGYDSWNACIEKEFQSEHGGRRRIFKLIQNAEVSENIGENVENGHLSASESTKAGAPRGTTPIIPIRQTEELAKLPPEKQRETYQKASAATNGKPTEAAVKKAVEHALEIEKPEPPPTPKPRNEKAVKIIIRDSTGYAIPETALPLWNRRQEVTDILRAISTARAALKAVMDARKEGEEDMLFAAANINGAWGKLSDAWTTVGMAMPYAVCPTCQGRAPDNCLLCKGRAFISKHIYDCAVSIELKEVRVKSCVL